MSVSRIYLMRNGVMLLDAVQADTFWSRLRGLHAFPPLQEDQALVIDSCNSVQTFRMQYPIDVAFLDKGGVIRKLVPLPAGRVSVCRGAAVVVEMAAGSISRLSLSTGQKLYKEGGTWT